VESGKWNMRNETSPDRLMEHVENIARWVRLSGSEEEARAFDYIEQRLRDWGITYRRLSHPAYISWPGKASLTLMAGGKAVDVPCITHSMAASTPPGGTSARVCDAGAGESGAFRNFAAGAVALVRGLATPQKTVAARAAGACGVIFVNGEERHEMIVSPVWGSPSGDMMRHLPGIPVVSVLARDVEQVYEDLRSGRSVRAVLTTEVLTGWREIPLLTADIPGTTYPKEVVLLAGHVDSWHYGAMDNAGANAVQLEALRIFGARRQRLQRTLRVAFWSGHSHGRYAGSTWYVDHFWEELAERLVLHLYVDSVGGRGATVLSEAWAMAETKAIGAEAVMAESGGDFNGSRCGRGGDYSFYGLGVSCLFMCLSEQPPVSDPYHIGSSGLLGGTGRTGGLGSWWHTTGDTIDKLDPAFLHRDAAVYLHALARYLEEPRLGLDFRATARELGDHLTMWQEKAGARFDLSRPLQYCDRLRERLDQFYARTDLAVADFNRTVVRLQRILIPLGYSTGNRYEHGLAMPYPPVPALEPVNDLVLTRPGQDEEMHVLTLLRRRLNYVCDSLRRAVGVLGE